MANITNIVRNYNDGIKYKWECLNLIDVRIVCCDKKYWSWNKIGNHYLSDCVEKTKLKIENRHKFTKPNILSINKRI